MSGKWVYPKRTDGVYAIQFSGTQESAQEIGNALRVPVSHQLNPRPVGDCGGELHIGTLTPIRLGQYVIIDQDHELIEVIDNYYDYADKYSEDGR